jgi:hypothetical protein
MKNIAFKKIIKECVREVFREEIKDILLESLKSNNSKPSINESVSIPQPTLTSKPNTDMILDKKKAYMDIIGETAMSFTSQDVPKFNPQGVDPVNGSIPEGEVSLDQITKLINK